MVTKFWILFVFFTTAACEVCVCHRLNANEHHRTTNFEKIENNKTIYLTFDDGPSLITLKILDTLREENVKATFFVLDKTPSWNYILRRIVKEGHSIGLHGTSHDYKKVYSSVEIYLDDLFKIKHKVKNVTGVDTKIMRFIGGSANSISRFNPGIMTILTKKVTDLGYIYFDWNINPHDCNNISEDQVYNRVVKELGDESIYVVLLHDFEGNYKTANVLRNIINYCKNKGYQFDKITMTTPPIHIDLVN